MSLLEDAKIAVLACARCHHIGVQSQEPPPRIQKSFQIWSLLFPNFPLEKDLLSQAIRDRLSAALSKAPHYRTVDHVVQVYSAGIASSKLAFCGNVFMLMLNKSSRRTSLFEHSSNKGIAQAFCGEA